VVHVVSFSGGKDSTAMLLMMIEKGMRVDEIVFCDTGMEFPDMYTHIDKVEKHIGREATRLKSDKTFEYYMFEHKKKNGQQGYAWPDFRNRWCTQIFKKQQISKHLKQFDDVIEYHGIAADELRRAEKNNEKKVMYPLIEWGIVESQALKYCYDKGFDWNGLYERFDRVSCWCCPLKNLKELKSLYRYYPELWKKKKKMDEKSRNRFRLDYKFEQLEKRFESEIWWAGHQISIWEARTNA